MKKVSILGILLLILPVILCGCQTPYDGYKGEYTWAYTEACYSLLFAQGSGEDPDKHYDPIIDIIEEDEYGRKMFCYYEWQTCYISDEEKVILSLLICQKSDESYAYFYPDVNLYSAFTEKDEQIRGYEHVPDPLSEFKEEEIRTFK